MRNRRASARRSSPLPASRHLFPGEPGGEQDNNLHLKILAALSKKLIHESFRQKLSEAASEKEVYQLLQEIEEDFR